MLSELYSDQGNNNNNFICTQLYTKIYREECRLPQITIGAKERWQPYLGDLSTIVWVRYHTLTPKHKTHTRARALYTKTKKRKKVEGVKVKNNGNAR